MDDRTSVILIGGGGLGPWAWERVVPILETKGIWTFAPQLRATGNDQTPPATVCLSDWIEDTVTFIRENELSQVVLVAHSFAGYIAAGVIARIPAKIKKVIFLDAAIPEPGRSWFDVAGKHVESFMSNLATNGAIPFFSRPQLNHMYPRNGICDADWAWMSSLISPQPIRTYSEPTASVQLDLGPDRLIYIRCVQTEPPVAQINESTPGWTFRKLDACHWPMITHPEQTADLLAELV